MSKTVDKSAIRQGLRAVRNLLNDGGKHWIKGAEKQLIGGGTVWDHDKQRYVKKGEPEFAFCSIGGIHEVAGGNRNPLAIALKQQLAYEIIKAKNSGVVQASDYRYRVVNNRLQRKETYVRGSWETIRISDLDGYDADAIIVQKNDASRTTWKQISGLFNNAANRVR
jgi:hypothetical protein